MNKNLKPGMILKFKGSPRLPSYHIILLEKVKNQCSFYSIAYAGCKDCLREQWRAMCIDGTDFRHWPMAEYSNFCASSCQFEVVDEEAFEGENNV